VDWWIRCGFGWQLRRSEAAVAALGFNGTPMAGCYRRNPVLRRPSTHTHTAAAGQDVEKEATTKNIKDIDHVAPFLSFFLSFFLSSATRTSRVAFFLFLSVQQQSAEPHTAHTHGRIDREARERDISFLNCCWFVYRVQYDLPVASFSSSSPSPSRNSRK